MFLYVRLDTHLYVRTLGYMNVRTHGSRRTVSPGPATRRTWLGLAVLLVPALLVSMDISILFVASPAVTVHLEPTAGQWLWMMDIYSFVLAGLLVTMGGLADRIGRRRLLLIGAAAFGLASLGLAYAPTPGTFIAARALLGVGAATLAPSTLALVRAMFTDPTQRSTAVAAWTVAFTGGAVAGPVLGGFLLEHFWWGSVFLVNLPVMALLLVLAPLLVPESRNPEAAGFDLPGAGLSLVGIVAVVLAAKRFADERLDVTTGVTLVLGFVLLTLFVRRQRRSEDPLLDVTLFRNAAFTSSVLANALAALVMVGLGLLAFTYLQTVLGLSPLHAALAVLPTLAGSFAGAAFANGMARRLRPSWLVPGGLSIAAAGMSAIAAIDHTDSVVAFISGYTVLTFGVGIVGTMANSLILATAPLERAGGAASVSETGTVLGEAFGIAIFGTIATVIFRSRLGDSAVGQARPADTVSEAATIAERLPAAEADHLVRVAYDAFGAGLTTVAAISAGVLALAALATGLGLRGVPSPSAPAGAPGKAD